MEFPLQLDFGNNVIVKGSISLSTKNNEVFVTFLNHDHEIIMIDTLSQLQTIEFDDDDPLIMKFKGDNVKRTFRLEKESDVSSIWTYFQQYHKLKPAPGNKKIFSILPKNANCPRSNSTPLASVKFPHTADGISNNLIRESISELQIITVNESNFDRVFSGNRIINGISASELDVDPTFAIELWRRILGIQNWKEREYQEIKPQIDNIATNSEEAPQKLKKFVDSVKDYLPKMNFQVPGADQIAFKAFLAFAIHKSFNENYVSSMIHVVTLFTNCLLAGITDSNILTQSGDTISADMASTIVFTLFDAYYSKTTNIWTNLFDETMELIMLSSPSTHQMITNLKIENFDFISDEIGSMFIKDRDIENSVLLMTSGLSSASISQFVRSFLASSFILLHNRLAEIAEEQPSLFCDTYSRLLQTVNVRLLLHNSHVMSDFENDAEI